MDCSTIWQMNFPIEIRLNSILNGRNNKTLKRLFENFDSFGVTATVFNFFFTFTRLDYSNLLVIYLLALDYSLTFHFLGASFIKDNKLKLDVNWINCFDIPWKQIGLLLLNNPILLSCWLKLKSKQKRDGSLVCSTC